MTLFLLPSILALLIILAISLNGINPWAGKTFPAVKRGAASAIRFLAASVRSRREVSIER